MRLQLLMIFGIIALSFTAEKCRELVGEKSSSKIRTNRFTFLNCFDMSYGTIACITKEVFKFYLYYIRAAHVHKVRTAATKATMREALAGYQSFEEAIKNAKEQGNAAARRASVETTHVIGPVLSSGWDFFETLYVGGNLLEGIVRGTGTFWGAYVGGIVGEGKLRWVGFLVGSQLGSWVGSSVGLMVYDVGKGVQYALHLVHGANSYYPLSVYKEL